MGKTKNDNIRTTEASKRLLDEKLRVLDGLRKLNQDIGRDSATNDARMRNAERLIKEGSGL